MLAQASSCERAGLADLAMSMKYCAAYCLAYVAGKDKPSAKDVKKILESIEVEVDDDAVNSLVSALADKDIAEVVAAGRETMKGMVMGGGGGGGGGAAAGGAAEAAPAAEAKKKEVEEEEEEDMDFDLFG